MVRLHWAMRQNFGNHAPLILKGERAENGKSQISILRAGFYRHRPSVRITAARMGDERHVIGLVGKLLNASDELSSAAAIASETFKLIITGEPVDGRDVYKSRVEFRAIAQHIFATNTLPPFQGGMDRGVQRRLLVLTFNRIIPMEERIEAIGRRIAEEEADHLLAWAVDGAYGLIRQRNFTIPPSSKQALIDWIFGADPVLAWLDECVEIKPISTAIPSMPTRMAYEQFRDMGDRRRLQERQAAGHQRLRAADTCQCHRHRIQAHEQRAHFIHGRRNAAFNLPPPPRTRIFG